MATLGVVYRRFSEESANLDGLFQVHQDVLRYLSAWLTIKDRVAMLAVSRLARHVFGHPVAWVINRCQTDPPLEVLQQWTKTQALTLDCCGHLPDLQFLDSMPDLTDLAMSGNSVDVEHFGVGDRAYAPLHRLTNLQTLHLSDCFVEHLVPFRNLTALTILRLHDTCVENLEGIEALQALETLEVVMTKVQSIQPLATLTNLRHLTVCNMADDWAPLQGLTNLQTLDIFGSFITDLTPLSGLVHLTSLELSSTQVTDLTPIAGLPLKFLEAGDTHVADLTPVQRMTSLQDLFVGHTLVSDLTPLAGLTNLNTLHIHHTPVTDLTPLAGLVQLQVLHLDHTPVTTVAPLENLTNLKVLALNHCAGPVFDLNPLSSLTGLQSLYLDRRYRGARLAVVAGLPDLQVHKLGRRDGIRR